MNPLPPGLGYSAACRACNSPHRAEIDAHLLSGKSGRVVSAWLVETHGEALPHQGLSNHRREHLDVAAEAVVRVEAREQLAATAPAFEAAVTRVVADEGVLNEAAALALAAARDLAPLIKTGKFPQPVAAAFVGALNAARGAALDRHELLYGKRVNVESNTPPAPDPGAEALYARLAGFAARPAPRDDPGAAGGAPAG